MQYRHVTKETINPFKQCSNSEMRLKATCPGGSDCKGASYSVFHDTHTFQTRLFPQSWTVRWRGR